MNFYKTMIVVWNNFQRLRGVQQTTKGVLKFVKHEHQKGAIIVTKELVDEFPIKCNKSQFKRLKVNWTLIKEGSNQIKSNQIKSNQLKSIRSNVILMKWNSNCKIYKTIIQQPWRHLFYKIKGFSILDFYL